MGFWTPLRPTRLVRRRADAEQRERAHNPDGVTSLYSLGFDLDELAEERLLTLKRGDLPPEDALPNLRAVLTDTWDPAAFTTFLQSHGKADFKVGQRCLLPTFSKQRAAGALRCLVEAIGYIHVPEPRRLNPLEVLDP
jgi:hypothetical protein